MFEGALSKLKAEEKAGWLGTWIGPQGWEIYKTFQWEEVETANPVKVLDKLEAYVQPQKNKRIARYKLKLRKQSAGESFDNFVKDLRLILMDCEYTDPDNILIDSIIDGVHAKKLQERLLDRGEELTLAKAIEIGQQYEMSQKQVRVVRDEEPPILALDPKKTKNPKKPDSRKGKHCPRCGKDPQHDWNQVKSTWTHNIASKLSSQMNLHV